MTSIFVAKLDFNTTDQELKSLFEAYGKVNRVTIAKDRETGKPRGFAFVEMFNDSEAEAAIEALDNSSVNGRSIAVKKADDRGSKPAGPPSPRPDRQDNRPPRPEGGSFRPPVSNPDERPPFRKPDDDVPARPAFDDFPAKVDRSGKKEKSPVAKKNTDQPKQHKMEAYRKSGKSNRFLDFDDDDEDDDSWMSRSSRDSGWDEEE